RTSRLGVRRPLLLSLGRDWRPRLLPPRDVATARPPSWPHLMKGPDVLFSREIRAIRERDPASRSTIEAILTSSGLHAIALHRVAHRLWRIGLFLPARLLAQVNRAITGIEIHPGARIGQGVFIDHGMGVVIGETAIVGNNVTMYQGVTLGGTGKERGKRHPTIEENAVIGVGASILGAVTI